MRKGRWRVSGKFQVPIRAGDACASKKKNAPAQVNIDIQCEPRVPIARAWTTSWNPIGGQRHRQRPKQQITLALKLPFVQYRKWTFGGWTNIRFEGPLVRFHRKTGRGFRRAQDACHHNLVQERSSCLPRSVPQVQYF